MTKNREIKNALLRTVVKLYEGMYPSHDIKLSKKSRKILGSRFLSVERDNESEIEPLVRKNLEDFYKSANGVDVIDFSQSPTFFPSRIEQFYSLEEITEIARKSPCISLPEFSEYVDTRPDREKFRVNLFHNQWDEYEKNGGHISFLGLDKLENLKKQLLEEVESIVQDCIQKEYCYRHARALVTRFIEPYLSEEDGYDPTLYEGTKGVGSKKFIKGGDFKNFENFFSIYITKFGAMQKRLRTHASPEKFEEFCKKFNVVLVTDIDSDSRKGVKLPDLTIQIMKSYREKYGIPPSGCIKAVYNPDLLQNLFPKRTKIDLKIALEMQKDLNSGMFLKDVETKYGWRYFTIETKLKEHKLPYMIRGKWKNKD